jgi:UDP-glucose 4-epimerase
MSSVDLISKYLVVGGKGFIGRRLLYNDGGFDNIYVSSDKVFGLDARLDTIAKEVTHNLEVLNEYDGIIIAACALKPSSNHEAYISSILKEFVPIVEISQTLAKRNKKIIYLSSAGSLYDDTYGSTETSSVHPVNYYGLFKKQVEDYLILSGKLFGLDYKIFRVSNVYGPGQSLILKQGLISAIVDAINNSKPLHLYADSSSKKDYIYIDDVLNIMNILLDQGSGIFNVGSGTSTAIKDIILSVENISGRKVNLINANKSELHANIHNLNLDISKLKQIIPDYKFISMKSGLKRCLGL